MSNEFLNTLNEVNKPTVEAVLELNKLSVASLEKAVNLQLASAKSYAGAVLANLKAGAKVSDVKAAQDFAGRQGDVAKSVYEKLVKDGKSLAEIGTQYNTDVAKLVRGRVEAVTKSLPVTKVA